MDKHLPLQATYSRGIDWDGLNPGDKERIRKWGFARWWKWACDEQEQQIAVSRINHRNRSRV
jgi:hypothetical protein